MVGVCERLLSIIRRGGYLPSDFPTIESLVDEADRKLLSPFLKVILMSCVVEGRQRLLNDGKNRGEEDQR